MAKVQNKELEFSGISVYFIYSFMLSEDFLGISYILQDNDKRLELINSLSAEKNGKSYKTFGYNPSKEGGKWAYREPEAEDRKGGIVPHLSLKDYTLNIESTYAYGASISRDEPYIKMPLMMTPFLRLFPWGGTCTIKVEFPRSESNYFTLEQVLTTLALAKQQRREKGIKLLPLDLKKLKGKEVFYPPKGSLFSVFRSEIQELQKRTGLNWIDTKYIMEPEFEFQNPYVVTLLGLPSDFYNRISPMNGEERQVTDDIKKQLLAILYRLIIHEGKEKGWGNIDLNYAEKYVSSPSSNGWLADLNLDRRVLIHFYRYSTLILYPEGDKRPRNLMFPMVLDVAETIRARWHSYVIINAILDDFLSDIRVTFNLSETLEKIIFLRSSLTTCLEDPIVWKWGGTTMNEFYEEATRKFRIDHLRNLVLEKTKMLDKLYNDCLQSLRWKKLKQMNEDKVKKAFSNLDKIIEEEPER